MMAQKRYVLMITILVSLVDALQGMSNEKNKAINIMEIAKRLFDEKELEECPFFRNFEVMSDLFHQLKLKPEVNQKGGILTSSLPENDVVNLIKDVKGLFTVKKSSPESSSPIKKDQNQNKSKFNRKMSQSSDSICLLEYQQQDVIKVGSLAIPPSPSIRIAKTLDKSKKNHSPLSGSDDDSLFGTKNCDGSLTDENSIFEMEEL